MLLQSTNQIVCDADIKNRVARIGQNINDVLIHDFSIVILSGAAAQPKDLERRAARSFTASDFVQDDRTDSILAHSAIFGYFGRYVLLEVVAASHLWAFAYGGSDGFAVLFDMQGTRRAGYFSRDGFERGNRAAE